MATVEERFLQSFICSYKNKINIFAIKSNVESSCAFTRVCAVTSELYDGSSEVICYV